MNNSFKKDELVKVQGKEYPVVGGRLRLAHEDNKALSIETSIIEYKPENAVIQAKVTTEQGTFSGLGNASVKRDKILSNAILELAETRAIARALRFAGYGVEYTGFEEMPDEKTEIKAEENKLSEAQVKRLFAIAKKKGYDSKKVKEIVLKKYKVTEIAKLARKQYDEAVAGFEGLEDKAGK